MGTARLVGGHYAALVSRVRAGVEPADPLCVWDYVRAAGLWRPAVYPGPERAAGASRCARVPQVGVAAAPVSAQR